MAINDSAINGGVINGTLSQASIELSNISVNLPDVFSGKLLPTLSNITIHKSGSGFMDGNTFIVDNNSAKMLVKSSYNSGITGIEYINFGYGYYDTSQQILYPNKKKSYAKAVCVVSNGKLIGVDIIDGGGGYTTTPNVLVIGGGGKSAKVSCTINSGSINSLTIINEGSFYTHAPSIVFDDDVAVIQHNIGTYRKYPGYYVDSNSLISDESYIQDGYYYQTYSYELGVDELFEKYKNVVKKILHPSGYNIFGAITKFDTQDIISAIKILTLQIDQFPNDIIFPLENLIKDISKNIDESLNPIQDTITKYFTTIMNDTNISASDLLYVYRILLLTDSCTVNDSVSKRPIKTFNDSTSNIIDSVIIPPAKTLIIYDTNLRAHAINPVGVYGEKLNDDYFAEDYAEYVENFTKSL
jgi:hypothetical protein